VVTAFTQNQAQPSLIQRLPKRRASSPQPPRGILTNALIEFPG